MKGYEGSKRGKGRGVDELWTYLFLNRGRGILGAKPDVRLRKERTKVPTNVYRLVSLMSCVALDYLFVDNMLRFYAYVKHKLRASA